MRKTTILGMTVIEVDGIEGLALVASRPGRNGRIEVSAVFIGENGAFDPVSREFELAPDGISVRSVRMESSE